MNMQDIKPGMRLTWHHIARGGYGYLRRVPCTVESVGPRRVTILAELASGGTKRASVSPSRLVAP